MLVQTIAPKMNTPEHDFRTCFVLNLLLLPQAISSRKIAAEIQELNKTHTPKIKGFSHTVIAQLRKNNNLKTEELRALNEYIPAFETVAKQKETTVRYQLTMGYKIARNSLQNDPQTKVAIEQYQALSETEKSQMVQIWDKLYSL
jgi:hypothetical protein